MEGRCGADCALKCCPNDCSGRGECEQIGVDAAVCRCQPGYGGADCSLRVCPNNCSGNGHCRAPSHEPLFHCSELVCHGVSWCVMISRGSA